MATGRLPQARFGLVPACVYAGCGAVWMVAYVTGVLGSLGESTFVLFTLSAMVATLIGLRVHRPHRRWPFVLILCGFVLFVAGGAARESLHTLGNLSSSRSIIPDALTIPGYVLVAIALLGFARARRGGGADLDSLLDALLASLASLAFVWAYLIAPALEHHHAPLRVRVVLAVYPAMSVFFVAVAMQIMFVGGRQRPLAQRLLLLAMSSMLLGDIVYTFIDARVASLPPRVIDLPYAVAYLAYGACVLHPSMRELCEPVPRTEHTPTRMRLLLVSVALGLPAVVILSKNSMLPSDRIGLIAITATLTSAAILRVFRSLRAHARSEERLTDQATHDALTGLPNRLLVFERLAQALAHREGTDTLLALLFLDVDRFKLVNDSLGHSLGDELLVGVAQRLRSAAPTSSLVGRVGGDEFVVIMQDVTSLEQARDTAERLRACFDTPFQMRDAELFASASLGVAVAGPDSPADAESILRDADTAMYQAKAAGRDAVAIFDAEMRDRATTRARLEGDLHRALEHGELALHYQPVVSVASHDVVGFEALLRWNHPHLGTVPPLDFIPIAEDTGLIVPIGAWVLETACEQLAQWRRELPHGDALFVAVNVSARQLRDPLLVDTITSKAARAHVSPSDIRLELTESMLMDQSSGPREKLRALRDVGFRISIDDFGTGYSSLAYLRTFQVDEVKIDKSFVDDLDRPDTAEESLVAAIVAMANALGISTTAEGVETPRQAERLAVLRVDAAQGYVFSRPAAADQIPGVVARLRQLRASERVEVTESS
ncbi:MAG: putative bifunctional diguanylate cyclase/phosphodiesterase [Acidimicrobiia bacterium]